MNRQTEKRKDIPTPRQLLSAAPFSFPAVGFCAALSGADDWCGGTAGLPRGGGVGVIVEPSDNVRGLVDVFGAAANGVSALTIQTRGQSNLTKSASRGPIPRLGVTLGGRKLYH